MHTYSVGKPYNPTRTRWPEVNQFLWRGELELLLFLESPTTAEVNAVHDGEPRFALYDQAGLCVLLYEFGRPYARAAIPWSDAPFHQGMMPPDDRVAPLDVATSSGATRILLHVILVRADGGEVLVLRTVSLPPELTRRLFTAIAVQAASPFDQARYDRQLVELYQRYRTSEDLLAVSGTVYRGGE